MSERITLVNPYAIYECPDCRVRVATDSPDSVPNCPDCGLLGVALEFVGRGEFISAESKAEIERLRRKLETLAEAIRTEEALSAAVRDVPDITKVVHIGDKTHEFTLVAKRTGLRCPHCSGLFRLRGDGA